MIISISRLLFAKDVLLNKEKLLARLATEERELTEAALEQYSVLQYMPIEEKNTVFLGLAPVDRSASFHLLLHALTKRGTSAFTESDA